MPRLLPDKWIKQVAIDRLLELYEEESDFVQQWEQLRCPYDSLLIQLTRVHIFTYVNEMIRKIPHDLVAWQIDIQRLNRHLGSTRPYKLDYQNQDQLYKLDDRIRKKLAPYVSELAVLAYDWNIRASWAAEELLYRDIFRIRESIFEAASVTSINRLSDEQLESYLRHVEPRFSSDRINLSAASLLIAGGRQELLAHINKWLAGFELRLKTAGAKEPPSALGKHAKWWFEHYVHNLTFPEISREVAQATSDVGPYWENIQKAVRKFSELLDIKPADPT